MKNDNPKINISFANSDRDLKVYLFLKDKRDKSNYVKDLIEEDMKKASN